MHPVLIALFSTLGGFLATGVGFWGYLRDKDKSNDASTRLLMGLAHDKIMHLGMKYVERGWVTNDEYDDFRKYLYDPYTELGGNGTSEHIMYTIERLPIKHDPIDQLPIRESDRNS